MPNFTKQAIMDVFLRLLDEQPFDKITVQEIITECQISRNTFYYHFGDIYALLDALLHQDIASLKKRHRAGEPWDTNLRRVIAYIQENRRRVRHVYASLSHSMLEQLLYQATEELFPTMSEMPPKACGFLKRISRQSSISTSPRLWELSWIGCGEG